MSERKHSTEVVALHPFTVTLLFVGLDIGAELLLIRGTCQSPTRPDEAFRPTDDARRGRRSSFAKI